MFSFENIHEFGVAGNPHKTDVVRCPKEVCFIVHLSADGRQTGLTLSRLARLVQSGYLEM